MVSEKGSEFIKTVWSEERELFGVLSDDFIGKFSRYADWESLFNYYIYRSYCTH